MTRILDLMFGWLSPRRKDDNFTALLLADLGLRR